MGDINVWSWCYPLGGSKGPALPPPLWVDTATPDSQPLSTVYENEDQLLWSPSVLPEREVEEFLYRAVKRRWQEMAGPQIPEGEVVKDSEQVGVTRWAAARGWSDSVASGMELTLNPLVRDSGFSVHVTPGMTVQSPLTAVMAKVQTPLQLWKPCCGCSCGPGAVV